MIKTWEERMPKRHPEGVMFGLTQAQCMLMEITELREKLAKYESREPVAWMMVNNTHEACGKVLMWNPAENWHITWRAVPLYLGVKNES